MKTGFYPKLALDGIRKNKRMYLPYILTCIGMVMMFYIIVFLQDSGVLYRLKGGNAIMEMLGLGQWVIAFFACIFLFYTNSFLMRRRKKEFGLYNILGMGKRNIAKILFWETLLIACFSLVVGLVCGTALSKLAELGLVNIMKGDVTYTLSVSPFAMILTAMVYGLIFLLLLLNSLRQVHFSGAMALLRSENTGEKPPKGNWFFGILGVLLLGIAYYLAVTIENPISALMVFFIAVLMVIAGTYLLMIAGSVLLCRILQKKKSYYYKPNHFVSVSSMVYRMKRNGAGLASICILATMVLVMISSTTSLYFGEEDALRSRYPREINVTYYAGGSGDLSDERLTALQRDMEAVAKKHGVTPENGYCFRSATTDGYLEGTTVEMDVTQMESFGLDTFSNVCEFIFIPLADYNAMTGANESLVEGEALLYTERMEYQADTISFRQGNSFRIKKQLDTFIGNAETAMLIAPSMMIIVPDLEQALKGLDALADYTGNRMLSLKWTYNFDTGVNAEKQLAFYDDLVETVRVNAGSILYGSQTEGRNSLFALYGGLFYLGILLSIVFLFAAVLIIYYKQISEGYEDQARFEIMQKVGMTKREIRNSINSQLLTVFFLPLLFAALHLAFAFPIIRNLLLMFNLDNVALFAGTTALSLLAFALFYTLVYRITSNAYYQIVSGAKGDGR